MTKSKDTCTLSENCTGILMPCEDDSNHILLVCTKCGKTVETSQNQKSLSRQSTKLPKVLTPRPLYWWVVWISKKDNMFRSCHGYSEYSANHTAQVIVERYAIKQDLYGEPITLTKPAVLPHMLVNGLLTGATLYRDTNELNPLNMAAQAWALQAPSRHKAVDMCRKEWEKNQLPPSK